MVRPYIIPKCVQSDVQNKWDDKNIRRTAPSVLVKILYNIMYLQIKEKVLLYTQNCATIGSINIKNFYDPTYIYDQILRGVLGQGKTSVPCSAHHVIFIFLLKIHTC